MKARRILPRIGATLSCALALAVSPVGATQLTIPGAGPPERVLRILAKEFMAKNAGHDIVVPKSVGIAGGLRAIAENQTNLARIARRLNDEEVKSGLKQEVYAADAVTFAVGAGVGVAGLTSAQLEKIYSGEIDNWSHVGGPDAPIRLLVREGTEISFRAIKKNIPAFETLKVSERAKLVNFDFEMLEMLEKYRYSIGWLTLSQLHASAQGVKALSLDGVAASPESLQAGRYRISVEHSLIHKGSIAPAGRDLLAFIRSPAGREILKQNQLVYLER
jgi:phosphate transport system substrate-binding protein